MVEKDVNNDVSHKQSDQTCGGERITHSSTQTAVDDTDPESILVKDLELGEIRFGGNSTHRNDNFVVKRRRANFTRAKIWSFAHFFTACVITYFSVDCIVLLTDNNWYWIFDDGFVNSLVVLSSLCGVFGLTTSCGEIYLSFSPAKFIRRPLLVHFLRVLALLESVLVIPAIICVIFVPMRVNTENIIYIAESRSALTVFCAVLLISMVVDWITALAWLFHWWRYCVCCECFKSCCIFEPGEPLAPGVPDPSTAWLSSNVPSSVRS